MTQRNVIEEVYRNRGPRLPADMRNAGLTCKSGQGKASFHKRQGKVKFGFQKLMLQRYPSVLSNYESEKCFSCAGGEANNDRR